LLVAVVAVVTSEMAAVVVLVDTAHPLELRVVGHPLNQE
jgi:hypothetical protein